MGGVLSPILRFMNAKLAPSDAMRFLLAGNARATIQNTQTGNRFTYRIRAPKKSEGDIHFVSVLTGSDNNADYQYLGFIRDGFFYFGGVKSRIGRDAPSAKAFAWVFPRLQDGTLPASVEVWHEGCCGRCNRALTVPESIAMGLGPECAGRAA
jgi:hypothetical protein